MSTWPGQPYGLGAGCSIPSTARRHRFATVGAAPRLTTRRRSPDGRPARPAASTPTLLKDKVRASNDNGKLRIENLSTPTDVDGVDRRRRHRRHRGTADDRWQRRAQNLVKQFNELRDQLDKLADDASFNGINLLRGDKLKLTFNETGTSTIDIQAKDGRQRDPINTATSASTSLKCATSTATPRIDACSTSLADALGTLRSQASAFGSNLSIVQNRQDFTKAMINTLQTGAANLSLADTNEEARQPARPADPPAAVLDGAVAGLAGRPGGAAPAALNAPLRTTAVRG